MLGELLLEPARLEHVVHVGEAQAPVAAAPPRGAPPRARAAAAEAEELLQDGEDEPAQAVAPRGPPALLPGLPGRLGPALPQRSRAPRLDLGLAAAARGRRRLARVAQTRHFERRLVRVQPQGRSPPSRPPLRLAPLRGDHSQAGHLLAAVPARLPEVLQIIQLRTLCGRNNNQL